MFKYVAKVVSVVVFAGVFLWLMSTAAFAAPLNDVAIVKASTAPESYQLEQISNQLQGIILLMAVGCFLLVLLVLIGGFILFAIIQRLSSSRFDKTD